MRTWANLPACLRYSSLAPTTASGNVCTQHSGNALVWWHSHHRDVTPCILPQRTSSSVPVRTRYSFNQRLGNLRPRRAFSSTSCARIKLEDDEDDAEEPFDNGPVDRRPKRLEAIDVNKGDLRKLLMSRQPKSKRPPPPKPLDPQELRKIDDKARSLLSPSQMGQEFVDLKYAYFENHVARCAKINRQFADQYDDVLSAWVAQLEAEVLRSHRQNQLLEHGYCKIAFNDLGKLRADISETIEQIFRLQCEVFNWVLDCSQTSLGDLQKLLDEEYLKPRQAARANIDRALGYTAEMERQYHNYKAKDAAVRAGLEDIRDLWISLKKLVPPDRFDRFDFDKVIDGIKPVIADFHKATHEHRNAWHSRSKHLHPSRKSELWQEAAFAASGPNRVRFSKLEMLRAMIVDDDVNRAVRRKVDRRPFVIEEAMRIGYMKRWNGSHLVGTPALDIYWRQLDAMAPFELLVALSWQLSRETWYLLATLHGTFGPMWDNLSPTKAISHSNRIRAWTVKFRADHNALATDVQSYKNINWARLAVEEKLDRLGVPNEMQERGLFVALHPMSEDHSRFRRWVRAITLSRFEAYCVGLALDLTTTEGGRQFWLQCMEQHRAVEARKRQSHISDLGSARHGRKKGGISRSTSVSAAFSKSHRKAATKWTRRQSSKGAGRVARKNKSTTGRPSTGKRSRKSRQEPLDKIQSPVVSTPAPGQQNSTMVSSDSKPAKSSKNETRASALPAPKRKPRTTARVPIPSSSHIARAVWGTRSSMWKDHGKRSYCIDSTGPRDGVRDCSHVSVPEQSSGFCVLPRVESADDSVRSARNKFLPGETASELEFESKAGNVAAPSFWSHGSQRGPDGQRIIVHYCRSLESTEEVAQHFLDSKVIGFDMEWKAQAFASDSIQNNLSLIQIANEERIALFQTALFRPARAMQDFVAPSLKWLLESPDITKVGVAIKADSTRLRKYLGIEARSIFELSHLYKLVKYGRASPKLVNKRGVSLSEQIEEHFGLPLEKSDDVRCGDWTRSLNYRQVQYAATDPYACICLFNILELKRQAMDPVPPRPAHAELNLPIILPLGEAVNNKDKESLVSDSAVVDMVECP